jgi:hypothetical protein
MELPRGVSMSVPDLSRYGPQQQKDPIAIKVEPGDRVMVLLPRSASQNDVGQVTQYLKQWAPDVNFIILAGPESVTVIPPTPDPETFTVEGVEYKVPPPMWAHGAPVEDKEPQGHNDSDCPGPPECM